MPMTTPFVPRVLEGFALSRMTVGLAADELNLCISRSQPYGRVHRERLLLVASC